MTALIVTLHVLACVFLIVVVLLQAGKGAEMGATFGSGSSQALLGASSGPTLMGKITTGIAIFFMLTSLTLAYLSDNRQTKSVLEGSALSLPRQEAPAPVAGTTEETTVPAVNTTEERTVPATDIPEEAAEPVTEVPQEEP